MYFFFFFFFFKQKTAYEMLRSLVGSEMCIRDSINAEYGGQTAEECSTAPAAGSDHVQRGNLDPRRRGRHQRLAIRMGWHAFRPRRSLLGLAGLAALLLGRAPGAHVPVLLNPAHVVPVSS
eukprot:TRINITY_DN9321_c0_g1_i1.p1 TRINITY_DN9321_c0_g1~~TRINITY_DN9321_c0_g1_i1.p1  ORF type:complete len:121 (+),score=37.37 TRINITY_DN9321_c0_g1_i1:46-408(+)